jgi:integral membrane protein
MSPRRLFGALALAEAITWTLLITALVLRATAGIDWAVTAAGGIHGFVFLSYAATALLVAINQRWRLGVAVAAIASAVVPYATIPVELWLARSGRLAGDWRRAESDDPRDRGVIDRLARWFIRHPLLLLAAIAIGVAALFTVLLLVGPPGGRS